MKKYIITAILLLTLLTCTTGEKTWGFYSEKLADNIVSNAEFNTTQNNTLNTCSIDVPYFEQEKYYTCGPACLRMILASNGIIRSEAEIITACNTTKNGTTSTQISAAAHQFNLKASTINNANISDIEQEIEAENPVIVQIDPGYLDGSNNGTGHFIVIVDFQDERIAYHDPNVPDGKIMSCTTESFIMSWNARNCWMIKFDEQEDQY